MMALLNLLPWRRRERLLRLRRWSLLFGLILLFVPLFTLSLGMLSAWQTQRLLGHKVHLENAHTAFQRLYQQRLELLQQSKKWQQLQQVREARQQAIQIWESRLIRLATFKPAGTWLSSLSLQNGRFVVKGHTTALDDMQKMEKGLAQLEGVATVKAGAVQHDAKRGYGFTFTLTLTEVANALAD